MKLRELVCTNTYIEYFLQGTEPSQCTKHSGSRVNAREDNEKEEEKYNIYGR